MAPDDQNRRHTDRGYIAQLPAPLVALRNALGLGKPVTETLSSLSHWRRRPFTAQDHGAGI
jgi:hypothetical protein